MTSRRKEGRKRNIMMMIKAKTFEIPEDFFSRVEVEILL